MAIQILSSSTTGFDASVSNNTYILRAGDYLTFGGDAFDFLDTTDGRLVVSGTIYSEFDGVDSDGSALRNTVEVSQTGTITGVSDGIELGGSNHKVIVHGTVTGLSDRGVEINGNNGYIINTGTVTGRNIGVELEGDNGELINAGTIISEFAGVQAFGTGSFITNSGSIHGQTYCILVNSAFGATATVTNTGRITMDRASGTAIRGGLGNDHVRNSGDIQGNIDLGDGNDIFDGRNGSVVGTIFGSFGDDIYIIDDATTILREYATHGTDEVQSLVDYQLGANFENLTFLGNESLVGYGNALNNVMTGNEGDDTFAGRRGNDTMNGSYGNDTLLGGSDNDSLLGGDGDDRLEGNSGNDRLEGDAGDDFLKGGLGNDSLLGGTGDDTLEGTDGNDTLRGQGGNDTLSGGANDDLLSGGAQNDHLMGDYGRDRLYGDSGNDTLNGGSSADTLEGGSGNDLLIGGSASDRFIFADGFGQDIIQDFNATSNAERIDLSGVTSILNYTDLSAGHMSQVGADVFIDAGAGNTITLLGVDIGDLDAADFMF